MGTDIVIGSVCRYITDASQFSFNTLYKTLVSVPD